MLIFYFDVACVVAQPALPDITGSTGKGIVILSWACQYNVKSITVLRSMDSVKNYTEIGHVKKKDKGIQAFVDGHPVQGKNFYKLAIVFNSGLSWSSNHCHVYVNKASSEKLPIALPENDSIQRFIVAEDIGKPAAADAIINAIARGGNEKEKNSLHPPKPVAVLTHTEQPPTKIDTTIRPEPKHMPVISDTLHSSDIVAEVSAVSENAVLQKKKIPVRFEDPTVTSITFIRSRYIYINPINGHVNMYLPDDVKTHPYSVKFYDGNNHVIIDIPKINVPRQIIDKRNFQRSGIYKFVIRRDVTEYEEGYIEIR